MNKQKGKIGIVSTVLALIVLSSSTVFALPTQTGRPAQDNLTKGVAASSNSTLATTGQNNAQQHIAAAKLKMCQKRQVAINNIMSRIDTRAHNQITLFSTIATRVENFYTKKSKTVSNYSQLVRDIAAAKLQAETDLSTMKANAIFNCNAINPKGMISSFKGYLKQEISDLQNFRTSVKNLIVAVASANGVTLSNSTSHQASSTTGGKQ